MHLPTHTDIVVLVLSPPLKLGENSNIWNQLPEQLLWRDKCMKSKYWHYQKKKRAILPSNFKNIVWVCWLLIRTENTLFITKSLLCFCKYSDFKMCICQSRHSDLVVLWINIKVCPEASFYVRFFLKKIVAESQKNITDELSQINSRSVTWQFFDDW